MASISEQKKYLRIQIEHYRRSIFSHHVDPKIFDPLFYQRWFVKSSIVALYVSQPFEFPTLPLFDFCVSQRKTIVVPVVEGSMMVFKKMGQYKVDKRSETIFEPIFGEMIQPDLIDVFFIPLVAFDWAGGRLGRGGGYFDRLFADWKITGVKIGTGFEFQSCLNVPQDSFDVKMDYILTEKQFRKIV